MKTSKSLQNNARYLRHNQTETEKFVWNKLRKKQLGYKFARQYIINNKYIVDFVCLEKKLIIELDGGQHDNNPQDIQRDLSLTNYGYKILRFWNNEIFNNWENCYNRIIEELNK